MSKNRCGTLTGYQYGCRCHACKAASADYHMELRDRRRQERIPDHVRHGRITTYVNWSCRCPDCRAKMSDYQREYRARKKAQA